MATKPYNPFDYFTTKEQITALFDEALKDEDPKVFESLLGDYIRHKGVSRVALAAGIGRTSVYKSINRKSNMSAATLIKLSKAAGLHPSFQVEFDDDDKAASV